MDWLWKGVVIGLVVAAIGFAARWLLIWLQDEDNRQRLKELKCRHAWHRIDKGWGTDLVYITIYDEECGKCGAQRVEPTD